MPYFERLTTRSAGPGENPEEGAVVGPVVAVGADGLVVLRGREVPEGTLVEGGRGRFVGRVVKVFGPVQRPYLSVRPRRGLPPEEMLVLLGTPLTVRRRG